MEKRVTEGLFGLDGKVAVVTGGGTGLGRAMTAAFLAAGAARVYIASRKLSTIEPAARELDPNGRCIAIPADLSTVDGCRALAGELQKREPRLHILVNNSGAAWDAPFREVSEKAWEKVLQLNLRAPFFLTQALVDSLAAAGSAMDPARIINIGSIAGEIANGTGTYSYGLSKGALHHATRMLALELGPRNISVNVIAPGRFVSKMTHAITKSQERYQRESDLAGVAIFLASRAGAYVTGATVVVDGGLRLYHPLTLGAE
jgi:NAD(P)-dependent dehydrogenase (short-subunit alcohol dehydrogenase family)